MAKSSISGLPGRATPRSKTRSSLSSIPKATTSASSSSTPTSTNPFTPQLTKAAKRAAKRAELLSQTANKAAVVASNSGIQTGPLGLTKDLKDGSATVLNLSKSSLRRIKRRMKENLAGNKGGMSELQRAVEEVEGSSPKVGSAAVVEEPGEEEEDDLEYQAGVESTNPSSSSSSSARVAKNGAVSAKARKRALDQEMMRQPHILKDPTFNKSPFEALRIHARNTLTFDRPSSSAPSGTQRYKKGRNASGSGGLDDMED